MTKRIFTAIVLVTVVILLLSSALISVVLYGDLETQFFNQLKSETHTIAVALESGLIELLVELVVGLKHKIGQN